jgi:hypothetical protein
MFMGNFRNEQPLYLINLLVFWWLIGKSSSPFKEHPARDSFPKDHWVGYFSVVIFAVLLLPLVTRMIHDGLPHTNLRFPILP